MKELSREKINKYLEEDLPYRINVMLCWHLYLTRRQAKSYELEVDRNKCYWESQFLSPAFEVSIVLGRSLLHFLGIKKEMGVLVNIQRKLKNGNDDIFIWDIIKDKEPYPIDLLSENEKDHLLNLIKVANKASAHLTNNTSTKEELASVEPATLIIKDIMIKYVDGLFTTNFWV